MVRRMFGEYQSPDESSYGGEHPANRESNSNSGYSTYDGTPLRRPRGQSRDKRATYANGRSFGSDSTKTDSCNSAVEIVTPYWASNSAGKIRAIVNTQHLQQAIQQEVCQ